MAHILCGANVAACSLWGQVQGNDPQAHAHRLAPDSAPSALRRLRPPKSLKTLSGVGSPACLLAYLSGLRQCSIESKDGF